MNRQDRIESVTQAVVEEAMDGNYVVWALWDLDVADIRGRLAVQAQELGAPGNTMDRIKLHQVSTAEEAANLYVPVNATHVTGWRPGCFER